MLSLVSRRLLRASTTGYTGLLAESATRVPSCASSSICSPLSAGLSARPFSTTSSSLSSAGAFRTCNVRLRLSSSTSNNGTVAKPSFSGHRRRRSSGRHEQRLHGTVTAFKHRRGYGFVLAEGVVPGTDKPVYTSLDALNNVTSGEDNAPSTGSPADTAAPAAAGEEGSDSDSSGLHRTYFFTRQSLEGGFYVMEGERVSFVVQPVDPSVGKSRHLGAPPLRLPQGGSDKAGDGGALGDNFSLDGEDHSNSQAVAAGLQEMAAERRFCAGSIRFYNVQTHTETPVTPITLYGKVIEWDEASGRGVIAELDVERTYHADAPRFPVSVEDLDLGMDATMHPNRYVRFCLGPASPSSSGSSGGASGAAENEGEDAESADAAAAAAGSGVGEGPLTAQRVVIDYGLERRYGSVGRPLVPATADPGTASDQMRFTGVVREIRGARFGFIMDDLSGESIFFHATNARANVQEGDAVTYLLREMTSGKHAGKKGCFDVRRQHAKESLASHEEEGEEEQKQGGRRSGFATAAAAPPSPSAGAAYRRAVSPSHQGEDVDFDTLY